MITPLLMIWCPGHPRTKGSLEIIASGKGGGRAVAKDTPQSSEWRATMAREARDARYQLAPWTGPVVVSAAFLVPFDDALHGHAGDLDKLLRNLLDALEDAKIYENDRQVVTVKAEKRATVIDERTGMRTSGVLIDVVGLG